MAMNWFTKILGINPSRESELLKKIKADNERMEAELERDKRMFCAKTGMTIEQLNKWLENDYRSR